MLGAFSPLLRSHWTVSSSYVRQNMSLCFTLGQYHYKVLHWSVEPSAPAENPSLLQKGPALQRFTKAQPSDEITQIQVLPAILVFPISQYFKNSQLSRIVTKSPVEQFKLEQHQDNPWDLSISDHSPSPKSVFSHPYCILPMNSQIPMFSTKHQGQFSNESQWPAFNKDTNTNFLINLEIPNFPEFAIPQLSIQCLMLCLVGTSNMCPLFNQITTSEASNMNSDLAFQQMTDHQISKVHKPQILQQSTNIQFSEVTYFQLSDSKTLPISRFSFFKYKFQQFTVCQLSSNSQLFNLLDAQLSSNSPLLCCLTVHRVATTEPSQLPSYHFCTLQQPTDLQRLNPCGVTLSGHENFSARTKEQHIVVDSSHRSKVAEISN